MNPKPDNRSDELLGQLAHEFSSLVRADLELAAAEQAPQLRPVAIELAVGIAVGIALLLSLASASWAAIAALTLALPSWGAALIIAGCWAVIGLLLLSLGYPRRLLARLKQETSAQALDDARGTRDRAEQQMRETAERLSLAMAEEAAERELKVGVSAAEHLVGSTEDDAEDVLKELLLAPGRAGISLLERIVGRNPETEEQ